MVVRTGLDLRKVGIVADLPANSSPIQLRSEGRYSERPFVVAGRIIYEYDQGNWNEWHLIFNDGSSGWLSDAQLQYDLSFLDTTPRGLPNSSAIRVGRQFDFDGMVYEVTTITEARYLGVEGELPFEYWDKSEATFIDLRTPSLEFATIDYSDEPPLLFRGWAVEFEDLKLTGLREYEGWAR